MYKLNLLTCITLVFVCLNIEGYTQKNDEALKGWHLLDKQKDGVHGISLADAYKLMEGKKPETVVVAVIDGGTDTTHEDLKSKLWQNTKEIKANGKDDDGNGLIDDVYGWNFLGNAEGFNIDKENSEAVRMYHQLKDKFEGKTIDTLNLKGIAKQQFEIWKQVENKLNVSSEDKFNYRLVLATAQSLAKNDTTLQLSMNKEEFTIAELIKYQPEANDAKRAKFSFVRTVQMFEMGENMTNTEIFKDLNQYLSQQEALIYAKERPMQNYRNIIGDNPEDINDKNYGNKDIMGSDARHGTHVAGIIAADRNNNAGMDGVADNVAIMTLRVVPDGDEYDKDIALGIRYAVDHGAKIINMSFGKDVSPQQHWVEDAIQYAASKDVLLVHAAGNDGKSLEVSYNFPTAKLADNTIATNMITVGASSDSTIKGEMIANFTNYGNTMVDVLAPGVKIYAPVPTTDKYAFLEGTSMAAPVVSGIAALIRGYYPGFTAAEVKQIIMESADKSLAQNKYTKPGNPEEQITIAEMCVSGGIVNAKNALLLADQWWKAKNN